MHLFGFVLNSPLLCVFLEFAPARKFECLKHHMRPLALYNYCHATFCVVAEGFVSTEYTSGALNAFTPKSCLYFGGNGGTLKNRGDSYAVCVVVKYIRHCASCHNACRIFLSSAHVVFVHTFYRGARALYYFNDSAYQSRPPTASR